VALLPTLDAHEQVVRLAERRKRRSAEKLAAAMAEDEAASLALESAVADRTAWIAANPDPQLMIL
jgi:predicted amino acid dehydrogenase